MYNMSTSKKDQIKKSQGLLISKFEKQVNWIWYVDTIGPLPRSTHNHKYYFIVFIIFSGRTYLEPRRDLIVKLSLIRCLRLCAVDGIL